MKTRGQVNDDLDYLLTHTQCTGTLLDELALLRTALRRYRENGGDAPDAVAWAAQQISNSLTR